MLHDGVFLFVYTVSHVCISKSGLYVNVKLHFFKIWGIPESWNCDMLRIYLFGQNPYESICGLESKYISFFAIEYEYPWRDMDLSPFFLNKICNVCKN